MKRSTFKKTLVASFLVAILAISQFTIYADATTIPPAESIPAPTQKLNEENDTSQTDNKEILEAEEVPPTSEADEGIQKEAQTSETGVVVQNEMSEVSSLEEVTEEPQVQKQVQARLESKEWKDFFTTTRFAMKLNDVEIVDTPTEITNGSKLSLDIKFSIPLGILQKDNQVQHGDTLTFKLPEGFKLPEKAPLPSLGEDGYFTYDAEKHEMTFIFGPNADPSRNLDEYDVEFEMDLIMNSSSTLVNEIIEIIDPFSDEILQKFTPKPKQDNQSIYKTGTRVEDTSNVRWHVFINEDYQEIKNAKVSDLIDDMLSVESIEVYEYDLTVENKVTGRNKIDAITTITDNNVVVDLGDINKPREIVIITKADNLPVIGSNVLIKNTATLNSDDKPTTDSNTVTVDYKLDPVIEKGNGEFKAENRSFDWNVVINPGSINLSKGTIVTDALTPTGFFEYKETSFKFMIDGKTYSLEEFKSEFGDTFDITIDNVKGQYKIDYLKESEHKIEISYTTEIPEEKINEFNKTNNGSPILNNSLTLTSNGETVSVGRDGSSYQKGIVSKWASIDHQQKEITWNIEVNANKQNITNIEIFDQFVKGSKALEYDQTSFLLFNHKTNEYVPLDMEKHFEFIQDENGNITSFIFNYDTEEKPTNASYRLIYKTSYDPSLGEHVFSNIADTVLTTEKGNKLEDTVTSEVSVNIEEKANGAKRGKYNPETQTFTWTVYLNYNGQDINTYELVDTLTHQQQLVEGSVVLYEYDIIDADGSMKINDLSKKIHSNYSVEDEVLEKDAKTKNVNKVLTINIDKEDVDAVTSKKPQRIAVEFQTSLEGYFIPKTVDNKAIINYGKDGITSKKPIEVIASVDLSEHNGGNASEKHYTYYQEEGKAKFDWTLNLNKSGTHFDVFSIIDAINNTHTYDRKSLEVYSAKFVNGEFVKDQKLEEGIDFIVQYEDVPSIEGPNSETMKIDFPTIQENRMIIVNYSTVALLEVGKVEFSNALNVEANTKNEEVRIEEVEVNEFLTFSSGNVSAKFQVFTIEKMDEEQKPLEGVEFELIYKNSGKVAGKGVTDANGILEFKPLFTGNYILKETKTVPGYGISKEYRDGVEVYVSEATTGNGKLYPLVNKLNEIRVKKSSSTTGTRDLTTVFEVKEKVTNKILGSFATDANGEGVFNNNHKGLSDGEYIVTEIVAPKGHVLDPTPQTIRIEDGILFNEDGSETLQYLNHMGSVLLEKVDENEDTILLPIDFELYKADGTLLDTYTTENGKIEIINELEPGDYYFLEKAPSQDYVRSPEKYEFSVEATLVGVPAIKEISVKNFVSRIEFQKVDFEGKALRDAVFGIYEAIENAEYDLLIDPIQTITTDASGWVRFDGLVEGDYIIKEISAPQGYLLNETLIDVSIKAGTTNEKIVVNPLEEGFVNAQGAVTLIKRDGAIAADRNATLEGVAFNLYKGTPNREAQALKENLKTDVQGFITIGGLEPGDYYFVETKAIDGYFINSTPIQFTIKETGDATYVETISHTNYKANVHFTKTNGLEGLEGARFTLEKDGIVIQENIVSDEQGEVVFEDLGPGNYAYYETQAAPGYVRNTHVYTFTLDANEEATETLNVKAEDVINYKGSVVLSKVDANGNPLENAVYRLLDESGTQIGETYRTNEFGQIEITNELKPGTYTFEEVEAPQGFIRNTELVSFIISDNAEDVPESVNVSQINHKASIEFLKVDENGTPLAGAIFSLYDQDGLEVQESVSGENGLVVFTEIEPGDYVIKETKAIENYILNTETISVKVAEAEEGIVNIVLEDFVNYQGSFELTKVDHKSKTIGDAQFELYDEAGELVQAFQTRDGKIVIEGLAPGIYTLKEVKSPHGYLLSKETMEIVIDEEAQGKPERLVFDFVNEPQPIVKGVGKEPKKTLPATGMGNTQVLIGTSVFALGIALLALSLLKRNNEK